MSSIRFVAVPQPSGTVSVLVVPRVDGPFAESGLRDWAADLAAAELEIVTDPGRAAPVRVASAPDADLWRSVFPADTVVAAPALPVYGEVRVAPSAATFERVSATYGAAAHAIADRQADAEGTLRNQLAAWNEAEPISDAPAEGSGAWAGDDFHRTISLLREHPAVLRALGLIFDVEPPAGLLGATGRTRVHWPARPAISSPWTAYERTARGYAPAQAGDIAGGMIDASQPHWVTAGLDIDGAAARLRDAARAAVAEGAPLTLPPLRSQGLSLLREGRGDQLARRRDAGARRNGAADGAGEETLTAEDLVLGYRVDVRRQGEPWRSVTARLATYRLNGTPIGGERDTEDAHVKANSATKQRDGSLRGDETVVRWDGWSLTVPRPVTGRRTPGSRRVLPLPFDFEAELAVAPASLPALRFGADYRLRLRVADVTGGGPSADAPEGDVSATPYTTYRRYEPVLPPDVAQTANGALPGDGVDELVIRSDRDLDVAAFAAQHPGTPLVAERELSAPRSSLRIAEEHGALDEVGDAALEDAVREGSIEDPAAGGALLVVRDEPGTASPGASIDESWSGEYPARRTKLLRLSAPEAGRPRLEFHDGQARVRLAPAEQLTLDVSSFLAPGVAGHFAIAEWLQADADATTVISTGTHPMITPPRAIHVVHAVRKPLADPSGALKPQRAEGATKAVLHPEHPTLGVDVASTAQIDVSAAWEEWGDAPRPTASHAALPSIEVGPAITALDDFSHEFADTRHRRISYTATAVSRFRRYFAQSDPAGAFLASASLPEVRIPSSAPPPRPLVRSVSPGFRWSGTDVPATWSRLERRRAGGILRVELARPWYESGEGEKLAVLVWDAAGPPDPLVQVTRAGRDPIRGTKPLLTFPPVSVFAGAADATFHDGDLTAVPYDVRFSDDRWWADVHVPGIAASSYSPLVQLVLARYQADSLTGMRLSEPVVADPAPVLPDRTLVIERSPGTIGVVLRGAAGTRPVNTVRVSVERGGNGGGDALDVLGTAGIGWRLATEPVTGALGSRIDVAVPEGATPLRLVVRETEDIEGDDPGDDVPAELVTRTVFLDVIAL